MAKKTVILDCRVGKNVAGDTVALDDKLADFLISNGRATLVAIEPMTTSVPKKTTKKVVQD